MSRRRSGDLPSELTIAACLAVFLGAAWPYLLGTWIAVQLGADRESSARTTTGWVLETVYLAGMPFIAWLLFGDPARRSLPRHIATTALAVLTGAVLLGAVMLLFA